MNREEFAPFEQALVFDADRGDTGFVSPDEEGYRWLRASPFLDIHRDALYAFDDPPETGSLVRVTREELGDHVIHESDGSARRVQVYRVTDWEEVGVLSLGRPLTDGVTFQMMLGDGPGAVLAALLLVSGNGIPLDMGIHLYSPDIAGQLSMPGARDLRKTLMDCLPLEVQTLSGVSFRALGMEPDGTGDSRGIWFPSRLIRRKTPSVVLSADSVIRDPGSDRRFLAHLLTAVLVQPELTLDAEAWVEDVTDPDLLVTFARLISRLDLRDEVTVEDVEGARSFLEWLERDMEAELQVIESVSRWGPGLTDIDARILRHLEVDGPLTVTELGERMGFDLDAMTMLEGRLRIMEVDGWTGWTEVGWDSTKKV